MIKSKIKYDLVFPLITFVFLFICHMPLKAEIVPGKLYGVINQAFLSVDNNSFKFEGIVNNQSHTTRIGYTGGAKGIDSYGTAVKYIIELGLQTSSSRDVTFTQGDNTPRSTASPESLGSVNVRRLDISFVGEYGAISIGQGSTAGDGAAEVDITGTKEIISSDFNKSWGGRNLFFTNNIYDDTAAIDRAPVIGIFNNYDTGRSPRIRYDSGNEGFIFSASYSPSTRCNSSIGLFCDSDRSRFEPSTNNGSNLETTMIKFTTVYPGFKASYAYVRYDSDQTELTDLEAANLFSVSYKSGQFGIMYNYSTRVYQGPRRDSEFNYVKLVYDQGNTSASFDFALVDDVLFSSDPLAIANQTSYLKGKSIGTMVSHHLRTLGITIYYGYRRFFDVEAKGNYEFDTIEGYLTGVLVKFN